MDLIRGYGYLKTKNVPIVCYLTRSRRSNRILFFARNAFEEEGGGFMKKKRGDAKNESVEERKQNSRKNARKIFVFAKRNCFFSHQKLIRNRARRAPKWTKRNVNLNRNGTSGVSCSCLVFCKPSKLQKPLRPHRLSKLVFYHRQEKGDENIAFKRASVREVWNSCIRANNVTQVVRGDRFCSSFIVWIRSRLIKRFNPSSAIDVFGEVFSRRRFLNARDVERIYILS